MKNGPFPWKIPEKENFRASGAILGLVQCWAPPPQAKFKMTPLDEPSIKRKLALIDDRCYSESATPSTPAGPIPDSSTQKTKRLELANLIYEYIKYCLVNMYVSKPIIDDKVCRD